MESDRHCRRSPAHEIYGDAHSEGDASNYYPPDYSPPGSSAYGGYAESDEENLFPLGNAMMKQQLVGVTALACDGPRLLTGNAEGRVLFQDFRTSSLSDDDAHRFNAARQDEDARGGSKFWYRPRWMLKRPTGTERWLCCRCVVFVTTAAVVALVVRQAVHKQDTVLAMHHVRWSSSTECEQCYTFCCIRLQCVTAHA